MAKFFGGLLSFDKLFGPTLVKILYFLGLAAIGLATLLAFIAGLLAAPANIGRGLSVIVLSPLIGLVATLMWRFLCEAMILAFDTYQRLGEIRDRLPARDAEKTMF